MTEKEVELKVEEALKDDVGRGIVRIDRETAAKIGVTTGDIIEIKGSKTTGAKVWQSHPQDEGTGLIRMDGFIRHNSGSGLGDKVKVKKAQVKDAEKITIAPIDKPLSYRDGFSDFVKHRVLIGQVINQGDRFPIVTLGTPIYFTVTNTKPKGIIRVTDDTVIDAKDEPGTAAPQSPHVRYEDIGGLNDEISRVREMIELPMKHPELFEKLGIKPPKGVMLFGPPGTGKTLIAKAVASESNAHFLNIAGPEIMDKYYGESEKKLREIFEEAQKNAPSIIFIDEIDSIAPKRDDTKGEVERRVVAQLLSLMDGLVARGNVVVIAATNRPESIDPALRRPGRFDREIEIGVPDANGRREILQIHTRGMPIRHWDDEVAGKVLRESIDNFEEDAREKLGIKKNRLGELEKEIDEIQKEKRNLEDEIIELKKENNGGTGSLVSAILDKIRRKKGKIEGLEHEINEKKEKTREKKREIEGIEEEIKAIKEIKKDIAKDKSRLESIIRDINELNHQKEIRSEEDIRLIFASKAKGEKQQEIQELVEKLVDIGLLSTGYAEHVVAQSVSQMISDISDITYGFVGADLEAVSREAAMHALKRVIPKLDLEKEEIPPEVLEEMTISSPDFKEALKMVEPSAMREVMVEVPKVRWDDIGGLLDVKKDLQEAVEWPLKNPKAFREMGIQPPKGILVYGPPGCGKTLLAKATANESNANFIAVKGPELLSKWVGESEKGVREVFKKARQTAPSIIFFDEIDAIAPIRGAHSGSHVTETVVNQILTELDGIESLENVMVIGATNRPDIIDRSLLRPGRFDRMVVVPRPDKEARLEIFKIHTKSMPLDDDADLEEFSEITKGYTGADIESICREAALNALREDMESRIVGSKHFRHALEEIKPSVTEAEALVTEKDMKHKKSEGPYGYT